MTAKTIPQRSEIAEKDTWNMASIFETVEDWEKTFSEISASLSDINNYEGRLGESPQVLLEWLKAKETFTEKLSKLYMYAALNFSVDTTNQEHAARNSRAAALAAKGMAAAAFEEPEIISNGFNKLKVWMEEEPGLKVYKHYFDQMEKRAEHIRSAEIEELLNEVSDPFNSSSETHNILANADMTFQDAVNKDGEHFELSHSNITKFLTSPDRELRKTAYNNYADAHLTFKNTMANCLQSGFKQDVFMANARSYSSALEAALAPSYLPVEVYHNVVKTFRNNLPIWHRYWALIKKATGLEDFQVFDTRVSLVKSSKQISYEQAVDWIVEGVKILGDDYADVVRKGANELRWVDKYPNKGKRFGAFSAGVKGTQPFIMLSYTDDLLSLSTLAHELGHSLHSYLTWENQPDVYSNYSLFVAEIASNFHQAVVRDYLLKTQTDRDFKIAIIEEAMANFFRYFFIMPSLAIFDLEAHERIEKGEALTAQSLINLMADIFTEGYGPAVQVDRERAGSVWMQFSTHLYSNFYTYQYTTGISGAHALAEGVLSGENKAKENYLSFLKAGDSLYPLDALKLAGVDLTTPQPIEKTFQVLSGYIDLLEELLS